MKAFYITFYFVHFALTVFKTSESLRLSCHSDDQRYVTVCLAKAWHFYKCTTHVGYKVSSCNIWQSPPPPSIVTIMTEKVCDVSYMENALWFYTVLLHMVWRIDGHSMLQYFLNYNVCHISHFLVLHCHNYISVHYVFMWRRSPTILEDVINSSNWK